MNTRNQTCYQSVCQLFGLVVGLMFFLGSFTVSQDSLQGAELAGKAEAAIHGYYFGLIYFSKQTFSVVTVKTSPSNVAVIS